MWTLWRIIAKSFKWTWQLLDFIRNLVINILFVVLILVCASIGGIHIGSFKHQSSEHRALLLDISGVIVDKKITTNSRLRLIGHQLSGTGSDRSQENSLFDIVEAIRKAKEDYTITGIVLDLKNFIGASLPSLQYIGKALLEFRNSGKPVIAVGDNYSQGQYYLASFANKIWLSPHGNVDLRGLSTNSLYYKSLLNKLRVTTNVFRVGAYKSAVEPFIRDNMSPVVRAADSRWISELWTNYLNTVATNRQITPQQVFPGAQAILNALRKLDGDTAKYALGNKLVDALGSNIAIERVLIKQFGWDKKSKKFRAISIYDYSPKKLRENSDSIAVVFVNGAIVNGEEIPGGNNVSGNIIATQIHNARLDPKVKAIILRVNSPGGSVNASELIRTDLAAARTAGKPVVVSMGGMAASGGYWISTPANYIIANPSTLTGSIGIFGVINTVENSLDYLGVHNDGVSTSPLADVSITKPLPAVISQIIQLNIEHGYKRFVRLVSESRKLSLKQVNKIAQGHIWTGQDAKNNGLIDSLGDFDDAISKAAELAKLKQWHVDYYQDKPTFFELILGGMSGVIRTVLPTIIQTWLAIIPVVTTTSITTNDAYKLLIALNDPQNCYALCWACSAIQ